MIKHRHLVIFTVLMSLLAIVILFVKVHYSRITDKTKPAKELTQSEMVQEIRDNLSDVKQLKADVEKTKSELQEMINGARANIIAAGLNQDIHTCWLVHGTYNGEGRYVVVGDKPILFGFRDDGLVLWKPQP